MVESSAQPLELKWTLFSDEETGADVNILVVGLDASIC